MKKKILLLSFLLLYLFNLRAQELPHIVENKNGVKQLIVKGEPFIVMGGELNNSSASFFVFCPCWHTHGYEDRNDMLYVTS
jgi:hypothetical protein